MTSTSLSTPRLLTDYPDGEGAVRSTRIYGAWAAAYLFATTKWGSYAGFAPIFLADLLVAAAFWQLLTYRKALTSDQQRRLTTAQVALLLALPLWATIRIVASEAYGFNTFRDYAPYLYAAVSLLAAVGVARSTYVQRQRTAQLIWVALLFHLMWTVLIVVAPEFPNSMPIIGNGVRIFSPREDIDSAYLGVTATIALHRWCTNRSRINLGVALVAIATVLQISSRAGLISTFLCLTIAAYFILKCNRGSIRIAMAATLGPVAFILSFQWLLQLPAIARLVATVSPSLVPGAQDGYASAQGTTEARARAWGAVLRYCNETWDCSVFGAGFGSNFMAESGAARLLLGPLAAESGVRSPHNYFIGSYARLGLIGLLIIMALIIVSLFIIIASRRSLITEEMAVLVGATVIAIIPTALFGVTLESPFGSIPFFWAVGALFGYSRLVESHKTSQKEAPQESKVQ
ncbi:O-antigen ligase [Rhodococcus sp. BS-15]|uniref:O-antigen ligase family protein n=1 Tax=Rhodococcus sp. BS-15 TaxID=1304954 RepID=UPI000AB3FC56|nr:O-antigen ligase family protein [Rhodococcus sp. BS-15]